MFPDDYPSSDLGPYFRVKQVEEDIDGDDDEVPQPDIDVMVVEGGDDTLVLGRIVDE